MKRTSESGHYSRINEFLVKPIPTIQTESAMTSPSNALPAILGHIDADLDNSIERLFALLRIKSISTDSAFKEHCRAAAEHVAGDLASIGFESNLRPPA